MLLRGGDDVAGKMSQMTVYITAAQREELERMSKAQRRPRGEVLREALDLGFERIRKGDRKKVFYLR